jgi:hypothetical protein
VAEDAAVSLAPLGDDLQAGVYLDRRREVHEVAVDDPRDGVLTESRADLVGDILHCRPRLDVEFGAIWERYRYGGVILV